MSAADVSPAAAAAASPLRVAFSGTPEFAARALQAIVAAGYPVPLVLTQPDRPAGRGMKLQASAVKQVAQQHGLPVLQPQGLRLGGRHAADAQAAHDALAVARADVMVVAAYGLILPPSVLDLPRLGCLNIHASLLPRWRGAAPIQRAIEAGDAQTGITLMQMDAGLDTGPMLLTRALPITADDTAATLHDKLADLGAALVVEGLGGLAAGQLLPTPQPQAGVTYAAKIDKREARLDWSRPAVELERRLRAFTPWPGGDFTLADGTVIKVGAAQLAEGAGPPGEVLVADRDGVLVACGQGALRLMRLQRPSAAMQPAAALVQSGLLRAGMRLPLPSAAGSADDAPR